MALDSEIIREVLSTERRWVQAHRDLDLETIDEILSDHYRGIASDGRIIQKEELLASYRSGNRRWEIAESTDHEVQIHGDVAMMIGRWRGKGVNADEKFDYTARFLAIYAKENGAWKLRTETSIEIRS